MSTAPRSLWASSALDSMAPPEVPSSTISSRVPLVRALGLKWSLSTDAMQRVSSNPKFVSFGDRFNQIIQGVVWPASVRQVTFGLFFNQPIEGVVWPASLQLSFGISFDKPIGGAYWPASL